MSKAEKFIDDCTRDCSNIFEGYYPNGKQSYFPWIHPKQARRAVEIAREEIYEWLQKCLPSYIAYCNNEGVLKGTELYVNDLKQAMKDE
jgi:hypothetical protein